MKSFSLFATLLALFTFTITCGCGGGDDNVVIEAPDEPFEEEPAIEGMSDEEYDAAMEADMEG